MEGCSPQKHKKYIIRIWQISIYTLGHSVYLIKNNQ